MEPDENQKPTRYRAFISYAHDDRAAAVKLQKRLERYRRPAGIIDLDGREVSEAHPVRPVFLDTEELAAGTSLTAELTQALHDSQSLVVLCSPAAVESRWVSLEIEEFGQLTGRPIYLCVIEGDPDAVGNDRECVPALLREERANPEAADTLWLDLRSRSRWGSEVLRLVAALRNIPYATLTQRHRRRTRKRFAAASAVFILATALIVVASVIAMRKTADAQRASAAAFALELAGDAQSVLDRDPALSLRLAAESTALINPPQHDSLSALVDARVQVDERILQPVAPKLDHGRAVWDLAVSDDESQIAAGGLFGSAHIWDLPDGSVGEALAGLAGRVAIAFDNVGNSLVVSMEGKGLVDIDTTTGRTNDLLPHHQAVELFSFSADGRILVTVDPDGRVKAWNAQDYTPTGPTFELAQTSRPNRMDISPSGEFLATANEDGGIRVWRIETGELLYEPLVLTDGFAWSVAFSPDSAVLAASGDRGTLRLWDVATADEIPWPSTGHTGAILDVEFDPAGSRIVSAGSDTSVRLYEFPRGTEIGISTIHDNAVWSAEFLEGGRRLATAGRDGIVHFHKVRDRPWSGELATSHSGWVWAVEYLDGGRVLASAGEDRFIRLWDARSSRQLGEPLTGHTDVVTSLALSDATGVLASGSSDGTVRLWDAQTGVSLGRVFTHSDPIWTVAFTRDGTTLISGDDRGRIHMWDVASGRRQSEPQEAHEGRLWTVEVHPNRPTAISAGEDGYIRTWNIHDGIAKVEEVRASGLRVRAARFGPSGDIVAAAHEDGTMSFWDGLSLERLGFVRVEDGWLEGLEFLNAGSDVVVGGGNGYVSVWSSESRQKVCGAATSPFNWIGTIDVSDDGSEFATGDITGNVTRFDASNCRPIDSPVQAQTVRVWDLAFAPDSDEVTSVGRDGMVRSWNHETRQAGRLELTERANLTAVAYTDDDQVVYARPGELRIVDIQTQNHERIPLRSKRSPEAVAIDFSENLAAVVSDTVEILDLDTLQFVENSIDEESGPFLDVEFLWDGLVATAGADGLIRIWDISSGEEVERLIGASGGGVRRIVFDRPNSILLSAGIDGQVRRWRSSDLSEMLPRISLPSAVRSLASSVDGIGAAGTDLGLIHLFDLLSGENIGRPIRSDRGTVWALDFSVDGRLLASGGDDGSIQLWRDLLDPVAACSLADPHVEPESFFKNSPRGFQTACSPPRFDPVQSQKQREVFDGHDQAVWTVLEMSDGRVASAGLDNTVQIWSPDDPSSPPSIYAGHSSRILSVAQLPDGRLLTGGFDELLHLWDPMRPDESAVTFDRSFSGGALAMISLKSGLVAIGGGGGAVHVIDPTQPNAAPVVFDGHVPAAVRALVELPDGRIVSGSDGGVVHVWDPQDPNDRSEYRGHEGRVQALTLLQDGRVASGDGNGLVHVWVPTAVAASQVVYSGHAYGVHAITEISPGVMASGGTDGTVQIWSVDEPTRRLDVLMDFAQIREFEDLADGRIAIAHASTVSLWSPQSESLD